MAKKKHTRASFGHGTIGPGATKKKTQKPKKTVAPTIPPYGSYDPSLDQQERASNRGLGYLVDDIRQGNDRAGQDLGIGEGNIERDRSRSLADLLTARTRGKQDATTQTADLRRNYQTLGNNQRQAQAASGNLGGAILQARRKRTENQGRDQSVIDTNLSRFLNDNTLSTNRVGENADLGLGELRLGYTRGVDDRTVQQSRAQDEARIFGLDVNETRIDQAKQSGLLPAGFGSQKPAGGKPGAKPKRPRQRARFGGGKLGPAARRVF